MAKEKNEVSNMMRAYLQTKEEYKDCILLYRLGDFYELFFEDAVIASKELEIVLTGKDCGLEERAPMCGVPYHAAESYIAKLISNGHKVAICEQLSQPKKGEIVKRDVVRIITPGMTIDTNTLQQDKNNFIASVFVSNKNSSITYLDISTGELYAIEIDDTNLLGKLNDELLRISPAEIICNSEAKSLAGNLAGTKLGTLPKFNEYYDWSFDLETAKTAICKQFSLQNLKGSDIFDKDAVIKSCGALFEYVKETQKTSLNHIKPIRLIRNAMFMYLDANTRRNLEICASMRDGKKKGTLLGVLDHTSTVMGARMLRSNIVQPLRVEREINDRLDAVNEIYSNLILREAFIQSLLTIRDIERLCSKLSYNSISPKDCIGLKDTLAVMPKLKTLLNRCRSKKLSTIDSKIFDCSSIVDLIEKSINPDFTGNMKEGGYIKPTYSPEFYDLCNANNNAVKWLSALQQTEIEKTGIKNLKIGYNRVFGYYIEVNKMYDSQVPLRYTRRQTVSNCDRYITEELKEIENTILGSKDKALTMEQKIFEDVKAEIRQFIPQLLEMSEAIAMLDMLVSFATVSIKYNYVKPSISSKHNELNIIEGRHPVVEAILKDEPFVPNDVSLNETTDKIMLITGPNMAGKSTYMRQVALITLMAHIGCFVPAKKAIIPIIDRIFTRVGASDDLAFGQSTFMVEMSEVSTILNNATDNSLIILDEVGRGTSTYDGLSIAWAIVEYLSKNLKAKTLFATHYHELTDLEGMLDGVKNYRISVKEINDNVVFLRKIIRGGTNKSFGIEVARLAGLPTIVVSRAKELMSLLNVNEELKLTEVSKQAMPESENKLRQAEQVLSIVREIDINNMTPFMALELLSNMVEIVKNK